MSNPAVQVLTVTAAVCAALAVVLLLLAADGAFPPWVALIPAAVGVLAGLAALVVWGVQRAVAPGR